LAIGTTLTVSGIAWGSLLQRVKTLEGHVSGLPEIDKRLTRVETVVEGIQDDVSDIKADVKTVLSEIRSFAPEPRRRT
jgi:DNA-binding FrmR family transcriptional regulator